MKPHLASTRRLAEFSGATEARTRTPQASACASSAADRLGGHAPAACVGHQPVADLDLEHLVGGRARRAEEADGAEDEAVEGPGDVPRPPLVDPAHHRRRVAVVLARIVGVPARVAPAGQHQRGLLDGEEVEGESLGRDTGRGQAQRNHRASSARHRRRCTVRSRRRRRRAPRRSTGPSRPRDRPSGASRCRCGRRRSPARRRHRRRARRRRSAGRSPSRPPRARGRATRSSRRRSRCRAARGWRRARRSRRRWPRGRG